MLVRALYLSAIWSALSLFVMLIVGPRLRRRNDILSLLWLVTILVLGDLILLFTFGKLLEILITSAFAFIFGLIWIVRLPNWNAAGQMTWAMTLLTTGLFIIYTF